MDLSLLVSKKILVVDDMTSIRDEMTTTLKKLGFVHIHQAVDGRQAWEKVQEHASRRPFELIFSDIVMPNCTGIEFLKLVRGHEAHKTTPIIMVTSENELNTVLDAIEAGASSYVLKPFNTKMIEQKLVEVFTKPAAQK